jgi:quercetin dioxygenase-like cupin family protein
MKTRYLALTVVILVVAVALLAGSPGAAQQVEGIKDVKVERLGQGKSSAAPGYNLGLSRLTFAPGGSIAMHSHPGDAVFYVESGTITWITGQGAPILTRAGAGNGTPAPTETLAVGQSVTLNAGDSVFYDAQASHEVRNDGTTEAVVLYSSLRSDALPGIQFVPASPTP